MANKITREEISEALEEVSIMKQQEALDKQQEKLSSIEKAPEAVKSAHAIERHRRKDVKARRDEHRRNCKHRPQ